MHGQNIKCAKTLFFCLSCIKKLVNEVLYNKYVAMIIPFLLNEKRCFKHWRNKIYFEKNLEEKIIKRKNFHSSIKKLNYKKIN